MKTIPGNKTISSASVAEPTRRQIISGAAAALGALTLGASLSSARRGKNRAK